MSRAVSRLLSDQGEVVLTSWPGSPEIDSVTAMLPMVGVLLRRVRENQGLLLTEAAAQAGMSMSVLSRVERAQREPRLRTALVLCNVLGIRFSDLMRVAEDEAFPWAALRGPTIRLGCSRFPRTPRHLIQLEVPPTEFQRPELNIQSRRDT